MLAPLTSCDADQGFIESLDDQFLFADQAVNHEADFAVAEGDNDDKELELALAACVHPAQPDERHNLFADLQNFLPIDDMNLGSRASAESPAHCPGARRRGARRRGRAGP